MKTFTYKRSRFDYNSGRPDPNPDYIKCYIVELLSKNRVKIQIIGFLPNYRERNPIIIVKRKSIIELNSKPSTPSNIQKIKLPYID